MYGIYIDTFTCGGTNLWCKPTAQINLFKQIRRVSATVPSSEDTWINSKRHMGENPMGWHCKMHKKKLMILCRP